MDLWPMNNRPAALKERYSWRLPGEEVEVDDSKIAFVSQLRKIPGHVYVTRYRLRFEENGDSVTNNCQFDLPLGCISKVEKIGRSKVSMPGAQEQYGLLICCKDMRDIRFASDASSHSRRPLFEALAKYAFPITGKLPFYAVLYAQAQIGKPLAVDGWSLFDTRRELNRLGVPNEQWVISELNNNYEFADTYPRAFGIPASAERLGRDFLLRVGEFRSRHRIPVLSWIHPISQASITRCSQPLSGMTNKRSPDDEQYLRLIVAANADAHQLQIFDARPLVNAKVNRAKGGGYEESYDQCTLQFLNIHNIHVVRESLRKLRDAVFPRVDERNYLKLLEDSKWLSHLQSIIEAAVQIVYEVEHNKSSILVHCSDGWDRTAQLTALAMLQLDSHYRTIEGFALLIEKEWCSFGHKFGQRIGHGEDKAGDGERSPVFVQFIDCVWQMTQQFPAYFEFTTDLLLTILDELYSCRFGTFLYNNEKQRHFDNKCAKDTVSLWTHVLENRKLFVNPLFNGKGSGDRTVLLMNSSIRSLKLFKEYYARHNINVIAPGSQMMKRYGTDRACHQRALLQELVHQTEL